MEGADPAYEDREEEYAAGLRAWDGLPGIPASAGALVRDAEGRILLLKPTYKKGWTIPPWIGPGRMIATWMTMS